MVHISEWNGKHGFQVHVGTENKALATQLETGTETTAKPGAQREANTLSKGELGKRLSTSTEKLWSFLVVRRG